MTFVDLPTGSAVFVDANVLVYYAEPHPALGPACQQLLVRIENKEIQGFTSAGILSDVVHRIMTLEAIRLFQRPPQGIAGWLKQHPTEVQQLSRHRSVVDDLALIGLQVLAVTGSLLSLAA